MHTIPATKSPQRVAAFTIKLTGFLLAAVASILLWVSIGLAIGSFARWNGLL